MVYETFHNQTTLADGWYQTQILPVIHRRICNVALLGHSMGIYITGSWKLPVIMVGFGMFLLFDRATFHSRAINRIA